MRRFINLVNEHTKIKDISIVSYNFKDDVVNRIPFNVSKINQILGIKISENEYLNHRSEIEKINQRVKEYL